MITQPIERRGGRERIPALRPISPDDTAPMRRLLRRRSPMPRLLTIHAILLLAFMLSAAPLANARREPVITATSISADRTTVFIDGENFGRQPRVWVDGTQLTGVTVDANGTHVVA